MRERLLTWADDTWASRRDALIARARLTAVPEMQNPVEARFGRALQVLGYDIDRRRVAAGQTVHVVLYLRVLQRTTTPLRLNLSLRTQEGTMRLPEQEFVERNSLVASHFPVYGHYSTTEWIPGEILRDEVNLRIDHTVLPTALHLRFAVQFDGSSLRLPLVPTDLPQHELNLGDLEITAPR